MNLTLDEVVVLVAVARGRDRGSLATAAQALYSSSKFDTQMALGVIKALETQRLLQTDGRTLELTRTGWATIMEALPVLENIRAHLAGARIR